jgi:L-lactate dehydrogenase complex protein LldG
MSKPDQRAIVFARILDALRQPAPHRHTDHSDYGTAPHPTADEPLSGSPSDSFRDWLPHVGANKEEQAALFAQNAGQLKVDFRLIASLEEAAAQLAALAMENGWKRIATHQHPLAFPLATQLDLPSLVTDSGYAIADLEQCDAAITGCDALVAQTGSVLVSTRSAGGRALSVLPPHHVVVARESQLVPDLASALQLARKTYAPNWPSFLGFISGPSRTGDIERILVLGAHGPKKLTIFLLP